MTELSDIPTHTSADYILPAGNRWTGKVKASLAFLLLALLLTTCHTPLESPAPELSASETVRYAPTLPDCVPRPSQTYECPPCATAVLLRTQY